VGSSRQMCASRGRRHSPARRAGSAINRHKHISPPSEVQDPTATRIAAASAWHKTPQQPRYSRHRPPSAVRAASPLDGQSQPHGHAIRRTRGPDRIAPQNHPPCLALPRPKHPPPGNLPDAHHHILMRVRRDAAESTPLLACKGDSSASFRRFGMVRSARPAVDIAALCAAPRRAAQDSGIVVGFRAGQIRHFQGSGSRMGWRLGFDSAYLIWHLA